MNGLADRGASTSPLLVEAVCERLQQAGIPRKNIVIWDRLNDDLESAGFRVDTNPNRIRYIGNDTSGYELELSAYGSAGSRLSQTLTRVCDAVINLPMLKDHSIAGVTLALKNLFGAIHNPNKYHLNKGDPYIVPTCSCFRPSAKECASPFAMPSLHNTKADLLICGNGHGASTG